MERLDWKETIKYNILFLKILGLWPKKDESYKWDLYTFYLILCTLIFQFGHIFSQTANLYFILDDLNALTGIIFVLLMEMLGTFKTYCIVKNMKMLKELMVTVNSDLFQPRNLQQMILIQPTLKAWKLLIYSFWVIAVLWFFFWNSFPILDKSFKQYRLPFQAWYPYNVKSFPQYELTYFYQVISIAYVSWINTNSDALVAALNMYIAAQIDILCDNLKNICIVDNRAKAHENLRKCVHHHREILKFANYANHFYNGILFGQFFVGGISIGLGIFQLTVVPPLSSEFFSFLSYCNGIILQVFMYCWFGNEIEIKSNKLLYAVFESDWVDLPPEIKKDMLILNLKFQKSLKISALGLFDLSLDTFVKILRTAWSYFALLRQVQES